MYTRECFNQQAQLLASALSSPNYHERLQLTNENDDQSNEDAIYTSLDGWALKHDQGVSYLQACPLILRRRANATDVDDDDVCSDHDRLDYLVGDNEDFENDFPPDENEYCQQGREAVATLTHNNDDDVLFEWSFQVHYHDTWGVPVLYFQAHHYDTGKRCTRADLLDDLGVDHRSGGGNGGGFEDEFFVSEEEHPLTGTPWCYLHPCRTEARLSLLLLGKEIEEDGDNNDEHSSSSPHPLLLASWLSMILPAVKCKVPIPTFRYLQRELS